MTPPTTGSVNPRRAWAERLLVRGGLLVTGALLVSALGAWSQRVRWTNESAASASAVPSAAQLTAARGGAEAAKAGLKRTKTVMAYASRYQIPADLSAAIYDVAVAEGIEAPIAYRLVQIESNFKRTARSSAGALGLTQIQLGTARHYNRRITEADLLDRDLNLRLGFRYLNDLMVQFDHDSHLALLAYNRGPGRVEEILAEGGNPRNGYSSAVLKGVKPTAPVRGASN